jgi:hypothetical protein
MEKSVDSVHASWTTASSRSMVDPHGGADGKPPESGRDGALACRCSPTVAGKLQSGWATRVKWWRQWSSVGVCSDVGEEERGTVSGAGCSRAEVPLL